MTAPQLRPYLTTDLTEVADLRRAAIFDLTEEDYSEDQRAAWADYTDEDALHARLTAGLALVVASEEHGVVGFGALKDNNFVEYLFTRPDFARQGVATLIMNALEKLSAARGITKITANVSDSAQDFYAARGYLARQRNTTHINGEWLGSTTMEKTLVAAMSPQGRG